jgi:hypothetical protein
MLTDQQLELKIPQNLAPEVRAFLNSLGEFQTLVSKYNFRVKTHSERSLQTFLGLPNEAQTEIIKGFTGFLEFLTSCHLDGMDLRSDALLLKTFLDRFGFIYDDGISDNICRGDVVEVYSVGQKQVFRNLAFMDLCNYTLLDLLSHDPYHLYERSEKIKHYLADVVNILVTRPYNLAFVSMDHIPKHVLREKFSDQRLSSIVEFKMTYPLYTWPPKDLAGFISIQRGQNIENSNQELSFL